VIESLVMLPLALVLGVLTWRKSPSLFRSSLRGAGVRFVEIIPRISLALLAAGFIGKLLPAETVGAQIGPDSGFYGICLAAFAGGITPAGPIVSFPIIVVLMKAGAGFPQVVAFLTAWSVFALHRVLTYEIPMMGWRFSAVRLAASAPLPFIAAYLTQAIMLVWPGK
jgi:uncharacterized membrane protein YraQ (UPF0718 family)